MALIKANLANNGGGVQVKSVLAQANQLSTSTPFQIQCDFEPKYVFLYLIRSLTNYPAVVYYLDFQNNKYHYTGSGSLTNFEVVGTQMPSWASVSGNTFNYTASSSDQVQKTRFFVFSEVPDGVPT